MVTRSDIQSFLIGQKGKSKEEVLANFASWIVVQGETTEKLGKLISDIKSYPDWTWGE